MDINRLIQRAIENNQRATKLINQYKLQGYEIEDEWYIQKTKEAIQEIRSKRRINKRDIDRLKDYASVEQYDQVKVIMDIREATSDDISVPVPKEISLGTIRKSIRRQALGKSMSDEEQQIITQYAQTVAQQANKEAPDLNTPEAQKNFINKFRPTRDIAIGGSSTLINDLSYTYDALQLGRKFVETLQKIMSNPDVFVTIETWYRTGQEDHSYRINTLIQEAVKDAWYENFQQFSVAILEAINNLPDLNSESKVILDDFSSTVEVEADELFSGL